MRFLKFIVLLFTLILFKGYSQGDSLNVRFLSTYPMTENSSDIWGFEKDGIHYAIMGSLTRTNIFSLEDPTQPVLRHEARGARSIWRDFKHYGDYIYGVADQGTDGILIIDMAMAPDSISHTFFKPNITIDTLTRTLGRCHNIYIDENGFAYLAGCNIGRRGVLIFDLNNNPLQPEYRGSADLVYSHDAFTRGDTLYTSEIWEGNLGIYDVSDKSNPQLLALQKTSRNFTHNAWPSDDGKYVFTTDEREGAYVDAYDISDLNNIVFLDRFRPLGRENDGVIPHNTHYHKGYLVTSWYTDGVRIIDAHKPDNLVEVAYFDTWEDPLLCHEEFSGCWGAFPYTGSDIIYVSDINNGLFVLEVDYKRAAYLEGNIFDISNNPLNGVRVEIISSQLNRKFSNSAGSYKTGIAQEGMHKIRFTHPDYETLEVDIELIGGEVIILDVTMVRKRPYAIEIEIKNNVDSLVNANLVFDDKVMRRNFRSANNDVTVVDVLSGSYDVHIAQWGYENLFLNNFLVGDEQENVIKTTISEAYQDNFETSLGWTVENLDAEKGRWIRAIPREIASLGVVSRPGFDAQDNGNFAFVTGNGKPGAACDGLVSGITILKSPKMNLTKFVYPKLNFDIWYNKGLNPESPDELQVWVENGIDKVMVASFNDNTSDWLPVRDIDIASFIKLTDNMYVEVLAQSFDTENPVTAGFDNFGIFNSPSSSEDIAHESNFKLFPNPAQNTLWLQKTGNNDSLTPLKVMNINGQCIHEDIIGHSFISSLDISFWSAGIYFIQIGTNIPQKLIKY